MDTCSDSEQPESDQPKHQWPIKSVKPCKICNGEKENRCRWYCNKCELSRDKPRPENKRCFLCKNLQGDRRGRYCQSCFDSQKEIQRQKRAEQREERRMTKLNSDPEKYKLIEDKRGSQRLIMVKGRKRKAKSSEISTTTTTEPLPSSN